jgi:hypothetical protein
LILKLENQQSPHMAVTHMLFQSQPHMELNRLDQLPPQLPEVKRLLFMSQLAQELKHIPEILNKLLEERLIPLSHQRPQMDTLKELPLITQ